MNVMALQEKEMRDYVLAASTASVANTDASRTPLLPVQMGGE